ncbi:MAG: rod shape-determining protein MreC [Candidatus Omnitrophota bacterium]
MRIYRIRKFPARLLILILLVIIISIKPQIFRGVKRVALDIIARPFEIRFNVRKYFTHKKRLYEENLALKQQLATQSVVLARLRALDYENERLRELLNFKKTVSYKTILANILARDSIDWRGAIIIDKGMADGIVKRMPCTTSKGLIGSVAEVGASTSKVMLITDPNSRVGVTLEPSGESGMLIGSVEGTCKVIYLDLDRDIGKRERVLTAGFSAFSPRGLLIGEVTRVAVDEASLYKYAVVELSEDIGRIEEVICIDIER